MYAEHGPVMRALADAAADDPGVEQAYTGIVQRFVDATARHIEEEIAAGRILPLDAHETAKALVWMMERYLILSFGARAADAARRRWPTRSPRSGRACCTAPVNDGSAGGG